jgi:hypothetical protein
MSRASALKRFGQPLGGGNRTTNVGTKHWSVLQTPFRAMVKFQQRYQTRHGHFALSASLRLFHRCRCVSAHFSSTRNRPTFRCTARSQTRIGWNVSSVRASAASAFRAIHPGFVLKPRDPCTRNIPTPIYTNRGAQSWQSGRVQSQGEPMTSDHRVQVRALPGADQVPEPIQRRFKAPKIARKTEVFGKVLPLFRRTPFFGFAALKERKNLSSPVGILFCPCKAAPFVHQKNISLKCPDEARLLSCC